MKHWSVLWVVVGWLLWILPAWGGVRDVDAKLYKMGTVVVTATKVESDTSETGSSVTVITADEIEKKGKQTLLEVLQDVPGLSIMQHGPYGGTASIYLRGTKPGHTLVMLDGIELNDTMKTDRSASISHLLVDNIERIEIVRGAQSTLYGSDAMGGVINIITKKGEGKAALDALFEAGSHNTFTEKAGIRGSVKKMNYSLSASRTDTDGISKAAGGTEDDGYENTTLSLRLGYELFKDANLDAVFRHVDAQYDFDDGANQDDPNRVGWWDNFTGKIGFDHVINPLWDHNITVAYTKTEREYKDEADAVDTTEDNHNWYNSDATKVEWQHNICPVEWAQITAGLEYEEEKGSGDGNQPRYVFDEETMDNKAGYLQGQFNFFERLFVTPGIRADDNENFGSQATYKISVSYLLSKTNTRFKANWGTGFKAPSLYQLYSSYGDPNLEPDEGVTFDIGFEQNLFDKKLFFGLTCFVNDFKNMVEWDPGTSMYQNVDNAKMEGCEVEGSFKPLETLSFGVNYTYTNTEDKDTGYELKRRPDNQAAFSINWAFHEKANVNLSARYVGERWQDAANTERLDAYTTVDLFADYNLTDHFQLFGRVENLFDESYEPVSGFAGAGASFYAGIKAFL
jgi:vitamin B12 transporter